MNESMKAKLELLHCYLENLPSTIPYVDSGSKISKYSFDFNFTLDCNMEDMGLVGAISCQLEIQLGHCNKGPIIFSEWGLGLHKLVDCFESWLDMLASNPEVLILLKWLDDLLVTAENAFQSANTTVMYLLQ